MRKTGKLLRVLLLAMLCFLMPVLSACTDEEVNTAGQIISALLESEEESSGSSYEEVTKAQEAQTEALTEETQNVTEAVTETSTEALTQAQTQSRIDEDGEYSSKDEVAEYIHTYGKLPKNYITKNEAEDIGWISSKGNLWQVAPGMSIGGSRFGNYEGLLPDAKGRKYYECDIDYDGGRRNAKRIIYSNDGLIFYTEDHYESFEQLY